MLATILTLSSVVGHGAMTFPTPRNAIDGQLPAFKAWKFPCDSTHKGENCSITFCGDAKNCTSHVSLHPFCTTHGLAHC